jgi:UDP:flavonoid glycosyltransferase YjiC (YdhE family)
MRVLFVTAPFKSHLYVMAPMASAFRTAGHDVRFAAAPDLLDAIGAIGFTGVSVSAAIPMDVMMSEAEPDRGPDRTHLPVHRPRQTDYRKEKDPFEELKLTAYGCSTLYHHETIWDDIAEVARDWRPDLVVRDPFMFAGALAARVAGAVDARMLWGTDTLAQIRADCFGEGGGPHRADGQADPMRDWLGPVFERFGHGFDEGVLLGERTIIGWPTWTWRPSDVDYVQTRPIPFHGPHRTEPWMYEKPERTRICITQGISHRDYDFGLTASVETLFQAVAGLDVEVIATFDRKQLAAVSSIPDNVRVCDFVPFNVVLSTCSAIVHHGGYGTMAASLERGIPQLVVPNIYWNEKWWASIALANGLQEQGAGTYVADADQLTSGLLREHIVRALTDPDMTRNAARLREDHLRTPSPNDTVSVFEQLVAQRA